MSFLRSAVLRVLGRVRTALELDSWRDSDGCYISEYRGRIEQAARELSQFTGKIVTRFNRQHSRAELRTLSGKLVATVRIEGEYCAANSATVLTDIPQAKAAFQRVLGLPTRFAAL